MIKHFTLATALAMLAAVNAWAVPWGTPDVDDERDNVVTFLFAQPLPGEEDPGFFSCTGTLISPYVVLTAGHCTGFLDENGELQPNLGTWLFAGPSVFEAFEESGFGSFGAWIFSTWQPVFAAGQADRERRV